MSSASTTSADSSGQPVVVHASGQRRVAFVAHCLINQNAKVQEFARSPGVVPSVVAGASLAEFEAFLAASLPPAVGR